MFFANYFFHKFGCEICFVSTVITVWIRQDFWGSFYAVFLLILMIISFQSRTHLKRVWKTYTMMLSIIWAIQVRFNRFQSFLLVDQSDKAIVKTYKSTFLFLVSLQRCVAITIGVRSFQRLFLLLKIKLKCSKDLFYSCSFLNIPNIKMPNQHWLPRKEQND